MFSMIALFFTLYFWSFFNFARSYQVAAAISSKHNSRCTSGIILEPTESQVIAEELKELYTIEKV